MPYAMFSCLDLLLLHAYMFRSICIGFYAMLSFVLCLFLFYVDVRVTCSHACMMLLGYALLGSLCLCVYFHAIWLDQSLHMLICLDSCSSMSMCKVPKCLHVCFYAYMSRSMFSHAYVLGSMFFTCFILSPMCSCIPCHVCVPRPGICLSCHVLL